MADIDDTDDTEDQSEGTSVADSDDADGDSSGPAAGVNPDVAAYLQSKMQGQAGLAAAQDKANTNQLLASLARAGGTLARGMGHVTGADDAMYDTLDKAAQAPVQQFQAQQQEQAQDPASAQSKAVQSMIQKLYPGKFTPEQLGAVSAADAQDIVFKPLELDQKVQELAQRHEDVMDEKSDRAQQKVTDSQAKAYTAMRKDLETFRGNQSVQQAALAIQNADKALMLTQSQPTSQNLALLADEMGKVAMGGVPSETGIKALMPNNLATKVAELKSFVMSKPSNADVAEYIKNNADYLQQVKNVSQKSLTSYRQNIAKGYKNRVNPDDYSEAQADYGLGASPAPSQDSSPSTSAEAPAAPKAPAQPVARKTKDGRTALFDPNTKQFLRYQ